MGISRRENALTRPNLLLAALARPEGARRRAIAEKRGKRRVQRAWKPGQQAWKELGYFELLCTLPLLPPLPSNGPRLPPLPVPPLFLLRSSRCLSRLVSQHRSCSASVRIQEELHMLQKLSRSPFSLEELSSRTTSLRLRLRFSAAQLGRHAPGRQSAEFTKKRYDQPEVQAVRCHSLVELPSADPTSLY